MSQDTEEVVGFAASRRADTEQFYWSFANAIVRKDTKKQRKLVNAFNYMIDLSWCGRSALAKGQNSTQLLSPSPPMGRGRKQGEKPHVLK